MNRLPRYALVLLTVAALSACDLERSREPEAEPDAPPSWSAETPEEPPPAPEPPPPAEPPTPPPARSPGIDIRASMLNGYWIGGPPSAFSVLLNIDGTLVTARDLTGQRPDESTLFELVDVNEAHARFRAAGAGEIVQVHALFLTPDEALVWLIEEREFAVLRRVGQLPDALLGDWQAVETSGPETVRRVSFENDQLRVDGEVVATVYPLVTTADTADVVAVSTATPAEVSVLHFRRLADEVFLAWAEEGRSFAIHYRAGARPDWLPGAEASSRPSSPPPVSPPEPTALLEPLSDVSGARADLERLALTAISHFQAQLEAGLPAAFPDSTDWSPASDDCPLPLAAEGAFEDPTWTTLGFRPLDLHGFQYRFISELPVTFEVQARIDTDCDGVYHKLSIAGFAFGGEIGHDPVVEDNPGE